MKLNLIVWRAVLQETSGMSVQSAFRFTAGKIEQQVLAATHHVLWIIEDAPSSMQATSRGVDASSASRRRRMSEESDRMMVLLQELAALKKSEEDGKNGIISRKRRREITQEMKQLASQRKPRRALNRSAKSRHPVTAEV
ncbi:MAG TPA: hypothetical protein VMU05_17820 [Dongiaceae bacterium]|nr:hypothetical protein [Dongiaceae bacterium]